MAAGGELLDRSLVVRGGAAFALARIRDDIRLLAAPGPGDASFEGEGLQVFVDGRERNLLLCACSPANARALGRADPAFRPRRLGLATSVGCGDRLGLATPGQLRAAREAAVAPVLAQQSIREMERSARSPEQVMADAVFGALREGDTAGFGSDADHLKTLADVDSCLAAGFTLYTLDPSEHVDDGADGASPAALRRRWEAFDWEAFESRPSDCRARHLGRPERLPDGSRVELVDAALARAVAKYGNAVAHLAGLFRHVAAEAAARGQEFEVEISVDETASPTRVEEHLFVARELARLGVGFVALAPHFVGGFEKGVDYRGDLSLFRAEFCRHAGLARQLGDYKLSLHSGSDKFSLYPLCAELSGGRVHLKTAGTSYLEALRCVAGCRPFLFREIWDFARDHYERDRASYHVSASRTGVPAAAEIDDDSLPALLDEDGPRQILHVTYGSVLTAEAEAGRPRFRTRLLETLREHDEEYTEMLHRHFQNHLGAFSRRMEQTFA